MQISQTNQTIHYEDDLYDLNIELKAMGSSVNLHENANLYPSEWTCSTGCPTMGCN
ncbi:MAG: hypothetical protein ACRCU0_01705 [Candidatus Rhabdochlamydia sp.]